jgi:hypothetical protein
LSYTDPSGYFSLKKFVKKYWRVAVAAVASYFTFGAASGVAWGLMSSTAAGVATSSAYIASAVIGGAAAGFVGGAILSGTLKGAVRGAFSGAITGGIAGYYGNTYSLSRIASESIGGGISARIIGGKFEDGLKFALVVSGLNYANFRMRNAERRLSEQHPQGRNTNGESAGFYGDGTKLAGAREQFNSVGERLPCVSPAGGCQGAPIPNSTDQGSNFFGTDYSPGGVKDYVNESFAGPHDWFRNHVSRSYIRTPNGAYDIVGNMKNFSGIRLQIDRIANAALIPVSAPFAVAGILTTQVPLYTSTLQHLYSE